MLVIVGIITSIGPTYLCCYHIKRDIWLHQVNTFIFRRQTSQRTEIPSVAFRRIQWNIPYGSANEHVQGRLLNEIIISESSPCVWDVFYMIPSAPISTTYPEDGRMVDPVKRRGLFLVEESCIILDVLARSRYTSLVTGSWNITTYEHQHDEPTERTENCAHTRLYYFYAYRYDWSFAKASSKQTREGKELKLATRNYPTNCFYTLSLSM